MNIFDAFKMMERDLIVKNGDWYYKKQDGVLVESIDGDKWQEVEEFFFGTINGEWKLELP